LKDAIITTAFKKNMRDQSDCVKCESIDVRNSSREYLELVGKDRYMIAVCCWLREPTRIEMKSMPRQELVIANAMLIKKETAIRHTAKYLEKSGMHKTQAFDIARIFGGHKAAHREVHKEWGIAERGYYRALNKAEEIVGAALLEAVTLIGKRIRKHPSRQIRMPY